MIAPDTNVLVRYILQDHPDQALRSEALLDGAAAREEAVFLGKIVVCELAWVLRSTYGFSRSRIARVLRDLLTSRNVLLECGDELGRALKAYEAGRGDFADYAIREAAREVGCNEVATFDQALLDEPGFTEPGA